MLFIVDSKWVEKKKKKERKKAVIEKNTMQWYDFYPYSGSRNLWEWKSKYNTIVIQFTQLPNKVLAVYCFWFYPFLAIHNNSPKRKKESKNKTRTKSPPPTETPSKQTSTKIARNLILIAKRIFCRELLRNKSLKCALKLSVLFPPGYWRKMTLVKIVFA